MKRSIGPRVLVSALVLLTGAFAGEACVVRDPNSGMFFAPGMGQGWSGGGWQQQPTYGGGYGTAGYQPQQMYIQPPPAPPVVMGTYDQTYAAAQQRAQAVAAGVAPPVSAYPNPARPAGFLVGSGQPTSSMQQCWTQGCVMP